jgi:hypothetical protein
LRISIPLAGDGSAGFQHILPMRPLKGSSLPGEIIRQEKRNNHLVRQQCISSPLQEKKNNGAMIFAAGQMKSSRAILQRGMRYGRTGMETPVWRSISAPLSRRRETMTSRSLLHARWRAVHPYYGDE